MAHHGLEFNLAHMPKHKRRERIKFLFIEIRQYGSGIPTGTANTAQTALPYFCRYGSVMRSYPIVPKS